MNTWQRVIKHVVSAVPEDLCVDAHAWNVTVEWRGAGLWSVNWLGYCLSSRGRWDYEPIPSSRSDSWLATHRFTEEEALRLAHETAPKIQVNGLLPADLVARSEAS